MIGWGWRWNNTRGNTQEGEGIFCWTPAPGTYCTALYSSYHNSLMVLGKPHLSYMTFFIITIVIGFELPCQRLNVSHPSSSPFISWTNHLTFIFNSLPVTSFKHFFCLRHLCLVSHRPLLLSLFFRTFWRLISAHTHQSRLPHLWRSHLVEAWPEYRDTRQTCVSLHLFLSCLCVRGDGKTWRLLKRQPSKSRRQKSKCV